MAQLFGLIAATAILCAPPAVRAQTENFDSGAGIFTPGPNAWLKSAVHPAFVSYAHPANGSGLAVNVKASPIADAAPGVNFIYRTNIYTDFYMAVDHVAWSDTNQALLLIAHGLDVNPPQNFQGYVCNYDANQYGDGPTSRRQGQLQMIRVFPNFGADNTWGAVSEFTLIRGMPYRIVWTSQDNGGIQDLTVKAYDYTDLTRPLITLFNQDSTFVSGVCGIGNYSRIDDDYAPPIFNLAYSDSTFDNYQASGLPDPNADIAPAIRHPIAGTPQLVTRTPAERWKNFYSPASGISFQARTFTAANILVSATKLYLNNQNFSAYLAAGGGDSPTVNFSTPVTPLTANRVYSARVELEASNGLKGTNTFWFDTFSQAFLTSSSVKVIECEDFNYTNGVTAGNYQNNPPVSGVDTNGAQINGYGTGYLGLGGQEGVDYHDNSGPPFSWGYFDFDTYYQYRNDGVGTYSGTYELWDANHPEPIYAYEAPIDYPNTRQQYSSQGMKEYYVVRTEAGEWMNYTRSFVRSNYHVYLRVGSFGDTAASLDLVTSDPTLPGQTTSPLGTFDIKNQIQRDNFLYYPLLSNGVPAAVFLDGVNTVRLTMGGAVGKDNRKVYLNYLLFVPSTVTLLTSTTVNGTYAADLAATVNPQTRTITIPQAGGQRFYRLNSDASTQITSVELAGNNVVIRYTYN